MSAIKKKMMKQEEYINTTIPKIKTCTVLDKLSYKISQISTPIVKDIINNKFENGPDMNAVVCMFDNLFLSTAQSKQDGLLVLSVHVSEWVKKLDKINVDSTSGYVYFSDILSDIQVIIKLPQDASDYREMIREYFIGVTSINNLRYTLPNFVYTFGAFLCPIEKGKMCHGNEVDSIPFVVFEKIPGDNMQKMLETDKITFPQYLGMFIQVLLALEVAQRTISFTHFDFHTANLMCRVIKNDCKYSVPLDNIVYDVTATEFLPVIIDFGLSTVKYDGNIIGSYTFPEHGMKHYMLQGVDMFKFLYYSCSFSEGNLQRQIMGLMSFYGPYDPYKILINGDKGLNKAINEYTKKGSYSSVTTHTPLEFLNWIISRPEYQNIVSMYIKKKKRDIYMPLSYSTTIQSYDKMFSYAKTGRDDALNLIKKCITSRDSYVMSKYSLQILNGYNNKLKSEELKKDIHKMKGDIKKFRTQLIKTDYKMLWSYKQLELPNVIQIKDDSSRILKIKINSKKLKSKNIKVLKLIERYFNNITFFTYILPYLQYVYTIREIKSEKIYEKFITSFLTSSHYKIYDQHFMYVNRTYRWCNTLLNII
jgi:hypothetical protein